MILEVSEFIQIVFCFIRVNKFSRKKKNKNGIRRNENQTKNQRIVSK